MSVTDEIKSRLDIVEVVSDYLPLRKSGTSYTGFCPFHPNSRTPAFVVFPNSQSWRCFGACAEGGDVFSFLMKKEGWDFKEALSRLAQRTGVELKPLEAANKEVKAKEDRLADLLLASADYFHQLLLYAPQAEGARRYVAERGLTDETVSLFKIGFALDSWDACRNHFNSQGYMDEELIEAGLLTHNEEKGNRYDRFRNRLMIPIRNVNETVAGFGARTLDPDGLPKYLNSPQTLLFDKSHLLFGLDLAKRHIREAHQVVIVEGYMDVMQGWQAGFHNVVAQMGTALTESQLRLVKRYTKRFILALDADAAGVQATMRSLEVARNTLDRETDIRFDARGLVRYEGRLQADIRVATLPEGYDPDKLIRSDPGRWTSLVSQAKPLVAYVIDLVTQDLDLGDAKAKTATASQVLPLINDVVDPIEREHYRQLLARRLKVDERVLFQVSLPDKKRPVRQSRSSNQVQQPVEAPPKTQGTTGLSAIFRDRSAATELRRADFLRQCLSYPQLIAKVNNQLAKNQQAAVSEDDFMRPEDQILWRQLRSMSNRRPVAPSDEMWDSLEEGIARDRAQALLSLPKTPESEIERLPSLLVVSVLDWRLERVRSLIDEVEQLFRDVESPDNPELLAMYRQQMQALTLQTLSINKARGAMPASVKHSSS